MKNGKLNNKHKIGFTDCSILEVAKYYASTPSVRAEIEEYGERTDYSSLGGSNWVYVNYWGIEPGQTVEIQEKGKSLEVEKVSDEDPLFAGIEVGAKFETEPGMIDVPALNDFLKLVK